MKTAQYADLLPFEAEEAVASVGAMIALARRARGWTQADLAAKMGTSVNTIVNIEKGRPSVAFGQIVNALWVLDSLGPLRDALRPENDPVIRQAVLDHVSRRPGGRRG